MFFLRDKRLVSYAAEADDRAHRAPRGEDPVRLGGYEVLVDLADPKWGFSLRPTQGARRVWHLRAPTEQLRREWCEKLVVATMLGDEEPKTTRVFDFT